jgi:hypothetical protein
VQIREVVEWGRAGVEAGALYRPTRYDYAAGYLLHLQEGEDRITRYAVRLEDVPAHPRADAGHTDHQTRRVRRGTPCQPNDPSPKPSVRLPGSRPFWSSSLPRPPSSYGGGQARGKFIILLASILGVAAIMFAARLAADDRKQTAKEERWRAKVAGSPSRARAEVQRDGYLRRNQAPGRGAHSWDLGGTRKFYPAPGPEAGRATPPTTDPGEWPHE